jgi:molybdopterin converting factor small subunit
MFVYVKLYGGMSRLAKKDIVPIEIEKGYTLKDVLLKLIDIYGEEMKYELVDMRSNEFSSALILVNNKSMPLTTNLDRKMSDGDKIALISFCAGG